MFRRKSSSLPKDPVFPSDLEGLGYVPSPLEKEELRCPPLQPHLPHPRKEAGKNPPSSLCLANLFPHPSYFITEKDSIRSIANPEQEFNYFISKNERVCEVQREAMSCSSTLPAPSFRSFL